MSFPTGPILPSADILNEFEHGKFVLSNLAAKRAAQLKEGAVPLVRIASNHPLTIALAEIAEGKIKPILGAEQTPAISTESDFSIISDEPLPAELGMLLPALDETEADLVTVGVLDGEVDHEDEEGAEPSVASLSDLLDDSDVEPAAAEGEEDTLSLTDLAEQENANEPDDAE
mgnify:CR=1 FL=1